MNWKYYIALTIFCLLLFNPVLAMAAPIETNVVYISTDKTTDYYADGTHDEITINQAISYVARKSNSSSQGIVHLKAGTYKTLDQIVLSSYVTLEGDGEANTIIQLQSGAPNLDGSGVVRISSGVTIAKILNLTIDANMIVTGYTDYTGLSTGNINPDIYSTIDDAKKISKRLIKNLWELYLKIQEKITKIFQNNQIAKLIDEKQDTIAAIFIEDDDSTIEPIAWSGVYLIQCANTVIKNVTIKNTRQDGIRNKLSTGTWIENVNGMASKHTGLYIYYGSSDITVLNYSSNYDENSGIRMDSTHNVVFKNVDIQLTHDACLQIDSTSDMSSTYNVTIDGFRCTKPKSSPNNAIYIAADNYVGQEWMVYDITMKNMVIDMNYKDKGRPDWKGPPTAGLVFIYNANNITFESSTFSKSLGDGITNKVNSSLMGSKSSSITVKNSTFTNLNGKTFNGIGNVNWNIT